MARLSLCLSLLFLGCAAICGTADAAPLISPKILGTTPASSEASAASTTTPLVFGEAEPEDGIIISGADPFRVSSWGATTSGVKVPTQHPEYEIVIFGQANCAGASVGRGLAGAFEESGIAVSVPADALTVLSAAQVNPSEPGKLSVCSGSLFYWEGNVPSGGGGGPGGSGGEGGGASQGGSGQPGGSGSVPAGSVGPAVTTGKPDAPRLHVGPAAVANNNSPVISGIAPGAASVSLYANGTCSGKAIASGAPSDLAAGFVLQVADNTTNFYSAVAVGGKRSDCSALVTYVEDSTAPVTRVTMGPGVRTHRHKAVFRFADVTEGSPGTSSFRCKVGKAKWKSCASPLRLEHLRLRKYVVRIRAVDVAGNAEKLGAKRIFKVVPDS